MNFKEAINVSKKEDATIAVNAGNNLVLLQCKRPGGECCSFVYYLFVNKEYNKNNRNEMQEFRKVVHLKRLSDWEKKLLLGKGTCSKVHCYEADQVITERLEPDTFNQYVIQNTLEHCATKIPVAPV